MHILLSAYACEPGKGSEPAVGWGWALGLARLGHRVTVVTRANNRPIIESAAATTRDLDLRFVYCDLPRWARWWKRGNRGVHLYYLLWQWLAYRLALALHRREPFDRVHHVTFVSIRQPSFMGGLGIPFVFGPVAGGDFVPRNLLPSLHWQARLAERLHETFSRLAMHDPLVRRTLRQAQAIYVNSEATRRLVPAEHLDRTHVRLAIGWDPADEPTSQPVPAGPARRGPKALFVGRLLAWKGLRLALMAMSEVCSTHPDASLTVVGNGPLKAHLQHLAARLGVADRVYWRGHVARDELPFVYRAHDVLLFPSLRDSGGLVVLEALANALPIVCLRLAGPGQIVNDTCGAAVQTAGRESRQTAIALADAVRDVVQDAHHHSGLRRGARRRLSKFAWHQSIGAIERELIAPRLAVDKAVEVESDSRTC